MKKITILSLLIILLFSCNDNHHKKIEKIHEYTISNTEGNDPSDIIFWYVISSSDGGYYYTNSTSRISDFSSVRWQETEKIPEEIQSLEETSTIEEQEVDLDGETESSTDSNESGDNSSDSDSGGDAGDGGGDGGE